MAGAVGDRRALVPLVTPACAFVAAALALVALAQQGWHGAGPGAVGVVAMVPATSLSMLLAAATLVLVRPPRDRVPSCLGRIAAAMLTAFGLVVVGQYVVDWGSVATRGALLAGDGWWMRRPSPTTGMGLTFIGISLFALGTRCGWAAWWASAGATATLVVAVTGLVGHAYGASVLYGLNRWGGTAVSTAVALGVLAVGVLFADPSRRITILFMSDSTGGHLLRRLVPAAFVAPLLLGWLVLRAEQHGLANAAFGMAMLVVLLIVLLVGLIFRQASVLHTVDAEREQLLASEREARAEADQRRTELERVTESRAKLLWGFSHDVRNPLSVADTQSWLLEDGRLLGQLSGKQLESVQRIRRSIRASLKLIDDLLELARTEAGQIELDRVATNVGEAVHEVVEDFRPQAVAVGINLDVRVPPGLQAATDPVRLRQILANLLSNAVKYAPNGRVTVEAQSRRSGGPRPGNWVGVSVADTGPGIPKDKLEVIFQEYTRLDPQARQGTGIGLAISRRIARLLGGDLTVESGSGCCSTFTLWLPPCAALTPASQSNYS